MPYGEWMELILAFGLLLLLVMPLALVLNARKRGERQRLEARRANRVAVPGPVVDGVQTYHWVEVQPEAPKDGWTR